MRGGLRRQVLEEPLAVFVADDRERDLRSQEPLQLRVLSVNVLLGFGVGATGDDLPPRIDGRGADAVDHGEYRIARPRQRAQRRGPRTAGDIGQPNARPTPPTTSPNRDTTVKEDTRTLSASGTCASKGGREPLLPQERPSLTRVRGHHVGSIPFWGRTRRGMSHPRHS